MSKQVPKLQEALFVERNKFYMKFMLYFPPYFIKTTNYRSVQSFNTAIRLKFIVYFLFLCIYCIFESNFAFQLDILLVNLTYTYISYIIHILQSSSLVLLETNWHKHYDSTIAIQSTNCYNPVYNLARKLFNLY